MVKLFYMAGILALLVACHPVRKDNTLRYVCGDYRMEISPDQQSGLLHAPEGRALAMAPVPSATGIRFQNASSGMVFHDQDGEATLFIGDKSIQLCQPERQQAMLEALAEQRREQRRLEQYRIEQQAIRAVSRAPVAP